MTLFVAAALAAGAVQAGAQDRPIRDRSVVRDRTVSESATQGRDRDQREQQERFTRTLKIGANGELHIGNISGNVAITRGSGNEVIVDVVKTAHARTAEDAKEMLDLVQVDISERGGRAEIKTRYPHGDEFRRDHRRNINVSVTFNVSAPPATRISVNSVSGDVTSKDIKGDVALESVSGSVRITNAGGVASGKSVSGNVDISDNDTDGQIEASSVSGSVLVRNVKARGLETGSVSGNVVLEDVECDRLEGQTVSGDVRFAGPLARGGRYELSSHSGGVSVAIAGTGGFELEATSFSGSVRSDIPVNAQANDRYSRRQRTLRGVHGDGSAVLELTTFSGNIVITRR